MISTVISFCTLDYRFLEACVKAVRPFSRQIIITVCDHLFDGTLENLALLEHVYHTYPDCQFIEFAYDEGDPYAHTTLTPEHGDWRHHWHSVGRMIPYYYLSSEWILFTDVDEIIDVDPFAKWLKLFDLTPFQALRLASYWYFREGCHQATTWPDAALLVRKNSITPHTILNLDERMGMFQRIHGQKKCGVLSIDQKPMIHHYSWVRTQGEMVHKTRTWGHHWERNWHQLIEEEFSRDFTGEDFVRKYQYTYVDNAYNPLALPLAPALPFVDLRSHLARLPSNVWRVTPQDVFRKEICRKYDIH